MAASIVSRVPQFTDEDHVWILTQCASDGFGEGGNVHADFALIDRRLLVVVVELDRIFNRDDVMVDRFIDVVDHAGQRRTFA